MSSAAALALGCAQLLGVTIPPSAIGLPTTGAVVTAASVIPATPALPEYCELLGSIKPVDSAAPTIDFELDLPAVWNRKALMFGGGGFDGTIPNTAGNVSAGPIDRPVPLARGYAVFASDSGHQVAKTPEAPFKPAMDASFALNDEALRNFTGDALKKTRDAALHLIRARYGAQPERWYFSGGSTGGREALEVAQRWPADWDGVIAWYPAWNHVSLVAGAGRVARALERPGAWLTAQQRRYFRDSVLAVCDHLDGLADGIVSNVTACNAAFDPAMLTCSRASEAGDPCLSDRQVRLLRVMNAPIEFKPPMASGETHYPGYNVYGADLGVDSDKPLQAVVKALALGTIPPAPPLVPGQSPSISVFWDQWVRFVFAGDPSFDARSLDPVTRRPLRARIDALSKVLDANAADYSAFAGKGGRILVGHGAHDALVSARSTEEYVARVQARMGADTTRGFLRYYEVPGYGHGPSTVFNAAWDSLGVLEDWVERGVAPGAQVVTDSVGVPGRTRPLCEWPSWPEYSGAGDVNSAGSFRCTR